MPMVTLKTDLMQKRSNPEEREMDLAFCQGEVINIGNDLKNAIMIDQEGVVEDVFDDLRRACLAFRPYLEMGRT